MAQQAEPAPATASIVAHPRVVAVDRRALDGKRAPSGNPPTAPISIYEVHIGSWLRPGEADRGSLWDLATERLIPYLADLGFTHLELLPITEHPFGGSWGYQPLGLFAPSAGFGPPESSPVSSTPCTRPTSVFMLDWVPAHFPTDPHGLARFDGTALYEHLDPREGFHHDWNTYIYNFGRREVQGFLIASALHWLEHFHVDGLRVDAVASMLYRDYSRKAGEWIPNIYGGRENLEAVGFLRHLNAVVAERCPGAIVDRRGIDGVARRDAPLPDGLGFSFKWNMGWMHDTLRYIEHEPIHRAYPSRRHDVRPALRLLGKIHPAALPRRGRARQRLAARKDAGRSLADVSPTCALISASCGRIRARSFCSWACEIGQEREWNHDTELDWPLLDDPMHAGMQRLVRDLNRLYRRRAVAASARCTRLRASAG